MDQKRFFFVSQVEKFNLLNLTYRWRSVEMLGWFSAPSIPVIKIIHKFNAIESHKSNIFYSLDTRRYPNLLVVVKLFSISIHQTLLDALPGTFDPRNKLECRLWEYGDLVSESNWPARIDRLSSKTFKSNHKRRENNIYQISYEKLCQSIQP